MHFNGQLEHVPAEGAEASEHPRNNGFSDPPQYRTLDAFPEKWGILTPYPEAEWIFSPESIMPPRPIERSSRAGCVEVSENTEKGKCGFQKWPSGQTETVSVRFRPKISACLGLGFGISVFSLFGVSAETACFGRITLFGPILAAHFSIKSTAKTAFYGQNKYRVYEG